MISRNCIFLSLSIGTIGLMLMAPFSLSHAAVEISANDLTRDQKITAEAKGSIQAKTDSETRAELEPKNATSETLAFESAIPEANVNFPSEESESILEAQTQTLKKTASKASLPEDQIALDLNDGKGLKKDTEHTSKLIFSFGILIVLGSGFFFFVKKNGFRKSILSQNQIKVLTQHHLGPKKSLAIVRVAGESILIGITDQNISHIRTLSLLDDEIPDNTPKNFDQTLRFEELNQKNRTDEDFSMKGLKDVVQSRIKNLRTLA